MDRKSIADALLALTIEMKNRTKISQLREVFQQIEEAQRAGVRNAKIVETLNRQGFTLTVKSFEMMLYRIREKLRSELSQGTGNTSAKPLDMNQRSGASQAMPADEAAYITNHFALKARACSLPDSNGSESKELKPAADELSDLDTKQRRERLGNQFIKDQPTNPLLKLIKDQRK